MAKHWSEMSKDERESTGQTKKEYNRSTGQERYAEGGELEHRSLAKEKAQTYSSNNESTAPAASSSSFNLSSDPNDSYEDIQKKYQTIYRNEKIFGIPEGRDVYAEAGLRNPSFAYDTPPGTDLNDWSDKYGGDINEAFRAMGYHHDGYNDGWHKPDTLDRGTFNLDPDAYGNKLPEIFGEGGKNPNDPEYNKTYDYSTQIPIMSNWGESEQRKLELEKNYGGKIEDLNKEIYPSRPGMY